MIFHRQAKVLELSLKPKSIALASDNSRMDMVKMMEKTPKLHMKGETGISKMILRFYNLDQRGIVELHVKVGWCFCVLFSPTA
jgi:hypothetical protein